jgi:hypothetical protein
MGEECRSYPLKYLILKKIFCRIFEHIIEVFVCPFAVDLVAAFNPQLYSSTSGSKTSFSQPPLKYSQSQLKTSRKPYSKLFFKIAIKVPKYFWGIQILYLFQGSTQCHLVQQSFLLFMIDHPRH